MSIVHSKIRQARRRREALRDEEAAKWELDVDVDRLPTLDDHDADMVREWHKAHEVRRTRELNFDPR